MSELFILIVDDDLIYTNKIKDYIDFDGQYNLSVANNSFEAYDYLKIQMFADSKYLFYLRNIENKLNELIKEKFNGSIVSPSI